MPAIGKITLDIKDYEAKLAQARKEGERFARSASKNAGTASAGMDNFGKSVSKAGSLIGTLGSAAGSSLGSLGSVISSIASGPVVVLTAAFGALVSLGVSIWDRMTLSAEEYAAKMDIVAARVNKNRAKLEQQQSEDSGYMSRLQELASKERLSNESKIEAANLIKMLSSRYGDLGISIDQVTGKIVGADAAQEKMLKKMARQRMDVIRQQIKSAQGKATAQAQSATASMMPGEQLLNKVGLSFDMLPKAFGRKGAKDMVSGIMNDRPVQDRIKFAEQMRDNSNTKEDIENWQKVIDSLEQVLELERQYKNLRESEKLNSSNDKEKAASLRKNAEASQKREDFMANEEFNVKYQDLINKGLTEQAERLKLVNELKKQGVKIDETAGSFSEEQIRKNIAALEARKVKNAKPITYWGKGDKDTSYTVTGQVNSPAVPQAEDQQFSVSADTTPAERALSTLSTQSTPSTKSITVTADTKPAEQAIANLPQAQNQEFTITGSVDVPEIPQAENQEYSVTGMLETPEIPVIEDQSYTISGELNAPEIQQPQDQQYRVTGQLDAPTIPVAEDQEYRITGNLDAAQIPEVKDQNYVVTGKLDAPVIPRPEDQEYSVTGKLTAPEVPEVPDQKYTVAGTAEVPIIPETEDQNYTVTGKANIPEIPAAEDQEYRIKGQLNAPNIPEPEDQEYTIIGELNAPETPEAQDQAYTITADTAPAERALSTLSTSSTSSTLSITVTADTAPAEQAVKNLPAPPDEEYTITGIAAALPEIPAPEDQTFNIIGKYILPNVPDIPKITVPAIIDIAPDVKSVQPEQPQIRQYTVKSPDQLMNEELDRKIAAWQRILDDRKAEGMMSQQDVDKVQQQRQQAKKDAFMAAEKEQLEIQQLINQGKTEEAKALKLINEMKKQGVTLTKQEAEEIIKKRQQVASESYYKDTIEDLENQIQIQGMLNAGMTEEAKRQQIINDLKKRGLAYDEASVNRIMELNRQLGALKLDKQQKDEQESLYNRALRMSGRSQEADERAALKKARDTKGSDLTKDEKKKTLDLLNMSRQLDDLQKGPNFGDLSIKTNDLTRRGGFQGAAVVPDTDKYNRSIDQTNKTILNILQRLEPTVREYGKF